MSTEIRTPTPSLTVAIASRDRGYRDSLSLPLRRQGLQVCALELTANGGHGELEGIDVLVIDTDALSPGDLHIIAQLQARSPLVEVVAVAGDPPVTEVVEALRSGVYTVLQHPVADQLLVETIMQAGHRHRRARARLLELNHARYSDEPDAGRGVDLLIDGLPEESP